MMRFSPLRSGWARLAALAALFVAGCSHRETAVQSGDRQQILHWGNLGEPVDLDPQIITSTTDANIAMALFEGLTQYDVHDDHPVPAAAERWESTPDAKVWTFHLRKAAVWSNGAPVTADDFVYAYRRILSAKFASEYAYMLFHLENGEAYYTGKITDFGAVGAKAPDPYTLVLTLWHPLPYLPSLVSHQSWYPVLRTAIEPYGPIDQRGSQWTQPGHLVGNGYFTLAEWRPHQYIRLKKSLTYWDRDAVKLSEVYFYPIETESTEEAAFRAGQLHITAQTPIDKIAGYKRDPSGVLRQFPMFATYFYRFNVTRAPFTDVRVRRALSLAVDRTQIVERVSKGGQLPAVSLTPPAAGGFMPHLAPPTDVPEARRLLAAAGFPGGKGFPAVELLYNTTEGHRKIAEAIQEMWRHNLGIEVSLVNQESKVWVDTMRQMNYQVCRFAWTGDYLDPSSFIDLMVTGGGNNETGWSNAEYDRLDHQAQVTADNAERYRLFQRCEEILAAEQPILPIYYYERNILVRPEVKGFYGNLLDVHPLKGVELKASP